MGYNSKNRISSPTELDKILEEIFDSIIGKSFTLSISSDGSINSVVGMGAISDGIKEVLTIHGQMREQLTTSMIDQWLGERAIEGMVEQSLKIYPVNVKPGSDSWTMESKYGISNKKANVNTRYTLKDIKNDVAAIVVEATVELEPGGGLKGLLTGTQSGSLLVNTKTGIPILSDLTLNIKGTVKRIDLEMLMEMTAKIKTSMKEIK